MNSAQSKILILALMCFVGVEAYRYYQIHNLPTPKVIVKDKIITKTVVKEPKGLLLTVLQGDLKKDLSLNYKFLSQNQQKAIIKSILDSSSQFKINPLVVYSLIATESSFRFYVESPERFVTGSDGKKHKDKAIGLMSIIWSIWGKRLSDNHIISAKSELYQIAPNIRAGTFVLATLKARYKGDIDKAIKSYFGLNSKYAKTYLRKIKEKFGALAYNKVR